ncbi:unnamed protein product [Ectocarpus fasciculatus]
MSRVRQSKVPYSGKCVFRAGIVLPVPQPTWTMPSPNREPSSYFADNEARAAKLRTAAFQAKKCQQGGARQLVQLLPRIFHYSRLSRRKKISWRATKELEPTTQQMFRATHEYTAHTPTPTILPTTSPSTYEAPTIMSTTRRKSREENKYKEHHQLITAYTWNPFTQDTTRH